MDERSSKLELPMENGWLCLVSKQYTIFYTVFDNFDK